MSEKEYGIEEYVPMEGRHYTFRDMAATWLVANANPTSWYIGCVIGALGFSGAVRAALIGNPMVYFVLALVGYMGHKVGTSTMGLASCIIWHYWKQNTINYQLNSILWMVQCECIYCCHIYELFT